MGQFHGTPKPYMIRTKLVLNERFTIRSEKYVHQTLLQYTERHGEVGYMSTWNMLINHQVGRPVTFTKMLTKRGLKTQMGLWTTRLLGPQTVIRIHSTKSFKTCESYLCFNLHSNNLNRLQNCTCHDSSAVVACAKSWPDLIIIFARKGNMYFSIMSSYSLVKWVLGIL